MATKSLLVQALIDKAGKAHNCQASARHRIERGDLRLKVRNGRGWDHYCQACAAKIIAKDLEKLTKLQSFEVSEIDPEA